jgi:hypothetical protein
MGQQCSWEGDMTAVVVMVITMMAVMMKFIEENQNA